MRATAWLNEAGGGCGQKQQEGRGGRPQMLSLVSGHLVGWNPLQLLQLQSQGGSEAALSLRAAA